MDAEDFEFQISQYADGTLPQEQRVAVEERLRTDPAARKLLREYQQMQQVIGRVLIPLPMIDWDRMAKRISRTIEEGTTPPVYSLKLYHFVARAGLALAATFLLVTSMWRVFMPAAPQQGPSATPLAAVVSVVGPEAEAPAGTAEIDVSVGGPQQAETAMRYIYDDSVLVQRPVVALDGFTNQQMNQFH